MKKSYVFAFVVLCTICLAHAQEPTAKVQLAHNSADPLASTLDIYLNDELYLDDFAFRTATEFRDFVAGTELRIGIALATSQSASDVIVNFAFTFIPNTRNALMIGGVLAPSNFAVNPDPNARPISISAQRIGDLRETGFNTSQVDIVMWHGSTDVGAIDLFAGPTTKLVSALSYGYASTYFSIQVGTVPFAVHHAGGTLIETYRGEFGERSGQAGILVTSGFLKPGENRDGPSFGLYFIDNEGGPFSVLPALSTSERAFVQFVNNVADVDHRIVDVWVDDVRVVDDLEFRKATPYLRLLPNVEVTIAIADKNSVSPSSALVSMPFMLSKALHMIVINGLVSTSGYAANPDVNAKPLGISLHHIHDLKPGTTPDHTEIFVMNGSTDAPELDVSARGELFTEILADNLSYGSAAPYVSVPLDSFTVFADRITNPTLVGSWRANFTSFAGKAVAAVTTGFLNPDQNRNGERFTLMLVFDNGQTLILPQAVLDVASDNTAPVATVRCLPNPANDDATLTYDLRSAGNLSITVFNAIGERVSLHDMGLVPVGPQRTTLPCSTFATGMYQVLVESGAMHVTIPLWIVR